MADPAALPYRPCVGIALICRRGLVFAGQRIDNPGPAWQMPQGGIDAGESVRAAALRELEEETGVAPSRVAILRETPEPLRYDLPPELMGRLWGGRYRGQEQRWVAARFLGADDEIRIDAPVPGAEPEFSSWTWMRADDLIERIVPFKRAIYARVFAEFADLLA